MIHLILLSGGSGSRLWPLSNDTRSKQFLKVLRDDAENPISMVQRVFRQISRVRENTQLDITIATAESQALSIKQQIEGEYALVLEPERRDTAPAIMLACAHLLFKQNAAKKDTVIVMPIDTFAEQGYYDSIPVISEAVQDEVSDLVLLGVKPTYPSAKYGYILPASTQDSVWPVHQFVEKPTEAVAAQLIEEGALWNCGVFACKLSYIQSIFAQYVKVKSYEEVLAQYSELPKNSFDYEVVEKAQSISVVPYEGGWKDLGTWNTLTEEMKDASSGRVVLDEETSSNTHVINETNFPLVVSGINDAVVVATQDGILVSSKEQSAHLKPFVNEAAEGRPMYEKRRWGEYRVLDYSVFPNGSKALTKELILNADSQLSYQKHARRLEVWTIVSGEGVVVVDGVISHVRPGTVANIPRNAMHALKASTELHLIEVQLGDMLEESDIERFGDFWQ